jgi:hypothetical protein
VSAPRCRCADDGRHRCRRCRFSAGLPGLLAPASADQISATPDQIGALQAAVVRRNDGTWVALDASALYCWATRSPIVMPKGQCFERG